MEVFRIGQKLKLNEDLPVEGFLGKTVLKSGTPLYVNADKKTLNTLNGKMISTDGLEISDGFSAKGIADWIYQRVSAVMEINDFLEHRADDLETSFSEQVDVFRELIVEALTDLGFYGEDGNTH